MKPCTCPSSNMYANLPDLDPGMVSLASEQTLSLSLLYLVLCISLLIYWRDGYELEKSLPETR